MKKHRFYLVLGLLLCMGNVYSIPDPSYPIPIDDNAIVLCIAGGAFAVVRLLFSNKEPSD